MGILLLVGLAGLAASLVDGALGMGFGPTSSTILLAVGLTPAAASTTVNVAKVFSGLAGGAAHWRFGNVDRTLVAMLAVPGCLGALTGVTVLANVDGGSLRPYLSTLLFLLGVRLLLRFARPKPAPAPATTPTRKNSSDIGIVFAAFAGGITNGLVGAWGPVVTPVLLSRSDLEPRVAIGSVNTAEIAVALTASGSLLASMGGDGVDAGILAAMLVGGVLAAPLAAWTVRRLPPRLLGIGAGGLLLLTSVRELAGAADVGLGRWVAYAAIVAVVWAVSTRWRTPADGPAAEKSTSLVTPQ